MVFDVKYFNFHYLLCTIFSSLLIYLYFDVFLDLIAVWDSKEEYSYGYMIPFVSLYLVWQQKEFLLNNSFKPSWLGFFITFIAILLYFVGVVGDVYFLLRFSFVFILIGFVLSFFGVKTTVKLLMPILLLIFSFPLPPILQSVLTAKLQLISSQLGVSFIRACDIPVYLEGNVIDLGAFQLQVVEACSGLRYLFPLMSLAFICAYMFQVAFWKRCVLFLTSIPITVLMNSFRIGVIGLLVDNWGIRMAEGFIHDFEGWIVFMLCFSILLIEMWLLSWNERKRKDWGYVFGLVVQEVPIQNKVTTYNRLNYMPVSFVLSLIIVAIIFIKPLGKRGDFIPARSSFENFPSKLVNWSGISENLAQSTIDFLGLSDYLMMNYQNKYDDSVIGLYVAYYNTQKHGAVPHSPKLCIPGGGWVITDIDVIFFNDIRLNRVIINKGEVKQLVYYWYKLRGLDIANEFNLKWNAFLGSFLYQRTDGALVRLTTPISSVETIEIAEQRLQEFILLIDDELSKYVPN